MMYPLGAAHAANGSGNPKTGRGTQFDELFDGVDDLIKRVADVENPDIRRTRAKVHAALVIAKNALRNTALPLRSQPAPCKDRAQIAAFDPSPDDPEQNLGVALLVGLGLGLIVTLGQ